MNCMVTCFLWLPVGVMLGYTICHIVSSKKSEAEGILSRIELDVTLVHTKLDKLISAIPIK